MWWHGTEWSWWGWLAMGLSMVIFWVAVVVLVVLVLRAAPFAGTARQGTRPEDVLAERYARGEIDDDEYERRSSRLRNRP
jgi:putative membrane protein